MYVEIIYETGAKGVAYYETEEEMMRALGEHHTRAKNGEAGREGENAHPAERIAKVEVYNKHPQDLNEDQTMSAEVMKKELESIVKKSTDAGAVSVPGVAAAVRNLTSPQVDVTEDTHPHDSMFKMESEKTLTEGWDK